MADTALVLGAGMVGVSVALHLRQRGWDVALVDRQGPGEGASFGNAGLIQREAVYPHPFPRALAELSRVARNRSVDVSFHPLAMPRLASPLLRYWWNSAPERYLKAVLGQSRLVASCLEDHMAQAREAGATELLRPLGFIQIYGQEGALEAARREAERARAEFGVGHRLLDGEALAEAEPHLLQRKAGAIHWTDPYSVSDPHGLTTAYARLLEEKGGRLLRGDAATLRRQDAGWQVRTDTGPVEARHVVIALGAAAGQVTRPLGYNAPLFGKRGYHLHYTMQGNAVLNHPIFDADLRYGLIPMRRGIRLTTGVEFAGDAAPPTPIQLERATPSARALLPLGEQVEERPWFGVRPCTPDMLPIIGRLPRQEGAWCAFGHAHQGLTLGPTTGRLLSAMMAGETPFIDPEPYRPERF